MENLTYSNEDDRAYGLAGMTTTASLIGGIDLISEINIDQEEGMVTFSHSYFYGGSPAVSPKVSWAHTLRTFQVTAAMALGNIFARSLVRDKEDVQQQFIDTIHELMNGEGCSACDLEEDEIDNIFSRVLSYNRRIYGNPRVHPAIHELANIISRRRRLSHLDLTETLARLQLV